MKVVSLTKFKNEKQAESIDKVAELTDMFDLAVEEAVERRMGLHNSYDRYNEYAELLHFVLDWYVGQYETESFN